MKKTVCWILALILLLGVCAAAAEGTEINGGEKRKVTLPKKAPVNEAEDGISPTTGLPLAQLAAEAPDGYVGLAITGRYLPFLVQIDNTDGGIGPMNRNNPRLGNRSPWDLSYADVVYETPLYANGITRLSALFSDLIPESTGPVRSARVEHAWIREEWDAPFCRFGGQKFVGTSVEKELGDLGVKNQKDKNGKSGKNIDFDGTTGGKAWNPYFGRHNKTRNGNNFITSLHSVYVMPAGLATQVVSPDFVPRSVHTSLFTDEEPEDGDDAENIYITWGNTLYNSMLEYDDGVYYRYMMDENKHYTNQYREIQAAPLFEDEILEGREITFSNIIVQFIECEYPRPQAPKPTMTGTGNADYFMCGVHIPGVWSRETLQDRTVFYDMDGNEMEFQRGHTLIITMDYATQGRSVSYE